MLEIHYGFARNPRFTYTTCCGRDILLRNMILLPVSKRDEPSLTEYRFAQDIFYAFERMEVFLASSRNLLRMKVKFTWYSQLAVYSFLPTALESDPVERFASVGADIIVGTSAHFVETSKKY